MLYMANYVVFSGLYRIRPLRPLCFIGGHIGKFFFFLDPEKILLHGKKVEDAEDERTIYIMIFSKSF